MKKEPEKKQVNRLARNGLINILMFPGLGTLYAGRWLSGIGQVLLAIAGAILMFLWLYKILEQYYGLMFGDVKPMSVGWIGETGGVLLGISWCWALVSSLSFFREAARQEAESFKQRVLVTARPATPPILSADVTIPQWQRNGEVISRTFTLSDFLAAMEFFNAVAQIAEQAQHHPD